MKVRAKIIFIFSILLMLCGEVYSQAQSHNLPQPQAQGGPGIPPPVGLPIDFGISALIASGVALGVYHIRRRKED